MIAEKSPVILRALVLSGVLSLSLGLPLLSRAEVPATEAKTPPKSWIDPDTGHRVHRITDEPETASLYFNDKSFTPDGKQMVYTTRKGISVLDLATFRTREVVAGPVRVVVVGRKSPTVFYLKTAERALYGTNLDTGETKKLADVPPRGGIDTINADETMAAGALIVGNGQDYNARAGQPQAQAHTLVQPVDKVKMMEARLAARLPMEMYTIDLNTGKRTVLLRSTDWLNHLQFSPTDPTLLMYCHEGPWQKVDRIWMIHSDGTHNTLIHKRTMLMEIAGHEFWGLDGETIWYDWQPIKGQDFYLAGYDLADGKRTAFHMERNDWSIHFNLTKDLDMFTGDGGDVGQVAKGTDDEWIELFHPHMVATRAKWRRHRMERGLSCSGRR